MPDWSNSRMRWGSVLLALTVFHAVWALAVRAQEPPVPPPSIPPPSPRPAQSGEGSEERLRKMEEWLRRMEEVNQRLLNQVQVLSNQCNTLTEKNEELTKRVSRTADGDVDPPAPSGPNTRSREGVGAEGTGGRTSPREGDAEASGAGGTGGPSSGGALTGRSTRAQAGVGAEGTDARTSPREVDVRPRRTTARVDFAEGLEFSSEDGEFSLSFHDLTQAEFRAFRPMGGDPLHNQFFIPRQRWYFTGKATRNISYYTVINRGYGSLDLLDAFITLNLGGYAQAPAQSGVGAQGVAGKASPERPSEPDPRVRLRVGRMKTPYLYEYYSIAEGDLIAPERSLYAGNLAPNRQLGAMFLGELLESRLDYAAGVFNGPRRSFQDFNSAKDIFVYANSRPFLKSERFEFLKFLNIGGSFNTGTETNPTQPSAFRTANDQTPSSAAASLSPTFLTFNNNVEELGRRSQWSAHVVYYYKSLGLLAEYGGGFGGYGLTGKPFSTRVPFEGYMVQFFYFLTGEQISRRVNVVKPVSDFGYHRDGTFGPGAVEVHSRFSTLNIGRDVFTAGLADPNLWSNHAYSIDTGANWYLNYYTKIYFDWQINVFGDPVAFRPGSLRRDIDLFWLRFQVYF